jgi:hypothetical protein
MRRAAAAAVGVFAVTCVPLMVGVTADGDVRVPARAPGAAASHG